MGSEIAFEPMLSAFFALEIHFFFIYFVDSRFSYFVKNITKSLWTWYTIQFGILFIFSQS